MSILIKTIRIAGFRGLENIEVELNNTTVLTGVNNSGKTSVLKSLQLALSNSQFVTQDDFFIKENTSEERIIIDLLIIPINRDKNVIPNFNQDWEIKFGTNRIRINSEGNSYIPLRTIITLNETKNNFNKQHFIIQKWPEFRQKTDKNWYDFEEVTITSFNFNELPFFYMNAQRDILEDIKLRNSYLGKMLSKIQYSPDDIEEIETQIEALNEKAVKSSEILSNIKNALKELDSAMDTSSSGEIEITPFTKKIRDLSKGLTIYYGDKNNSFSMQYHGMGTRSWSSLLTLKSFITLLSNNAKREKSVFFPILAIEEPESHLHPNAQKKLYSQITSIPGQKIISTHSPYIAASSNLAHLRNLYKDEKVTCGRIKTEQLLDEDIRKINRQVINKRGEIFFSKVIVLFEGETEEQALPIFAQKYFGKNVAELGLDFIGVGSHGNYLTFLRFTEGLNIPWLIFSDAEENTKISVKTQFINSGSKRDINECVVFLDDGNNFERQLVEDGYEEEIKLSIKNKISYENKKHKIAKGKEIDEYDNEKIYKIISANKTMYGPAVAEQITRSNKNLPSKIIDLFDKIKAILTN